MIGFKVVNLDLLLQVKSEEQIRIILNDFESPLNPDIENFLKYLWLALNYILLKRWMEKSIHLFVYKRVRAIYTVMEIEQACSNFQDPMYVPY